MMLTCGLTWRLEPREQVAIALGDASSPVIFGCGKLAAVLMTVVGRAKFPKLLGFWVEGDRRLEAVPGAWA